MSRFLPGYDGSAHLQFPCRGALYMRPDRTAGTWGLCGNRRHARAAIQAAPTALPRRGRYPHRPECVAFQPPVVAVAGQGRICNAPPACRKSLFATLGVFLNFLKSLKITCRLNAKGAFCPLHTSPRCSVTDIFSEVFRQSEGAYAMRPYGLIEMSRGLSHSEAAPFLRNYRGFCLILANFRG